MKSVLTAAASVVLFSASLLLFAPSNAVAFDVNTTVDSSQVDPAIANFTNSGFVTVWNSAQTGAEGIYGQRYAANAIKIGGEFEVATSFVLEAKPAVATFSDNSFVVVWYARSGGFRGVYAQRFAANATKLGGVIPIASGASTAVGATLAVASNRLDQFIVVWEQDNSSVDIWGARFNKDGGALGGGIVVSATAKDEIAPAITALANGTYVVQWSSNVPANPSSVIAQRLTAAGIKTGGPFRVHTVATGRRETSSVDASPDGGFISVWAQYRTATKLEIRGQRFKSTGARNGAEFVVSTALASPATSTLFRPSVVVLNNGRFIVAWDGKTEPNRDVFGQRYLPTGVKTGANFIMNIPIPGDQALPVLGRAAGANGFVVIWEGFDGGSAEERGIQGRRFVN